MEEGERFELSGAFAQTVFETAPLPVRVNPPHGKFLAGAAGLEPALAGLESARLPLPHAPARENLVRGEGLEPPKSPEGDA